MLRFVNGTAGDGEGAGLIQPEINSAFLAAQQGNEGAGGSEELEFEVLEVTSPSDTSFVPAQSFMDVKLVEASPTIVASYKIEPDGSVTLVHDSPFPVVSLDNDNNTFILVTEAEAAPEPVSDPRIPPHLVDHSYAKNFKEPKKIVRRGPSKTKMIKKKPSSVPAPPAPQNPPPVVKELPVTPLVNNPKINIIRRDLPEVFRSIPLVHPLIQKHWKTGKRH